MRHFNSVVMRCHAHDDVTQVVGTEIRIHDGGLCHSWGEQTPSNITVQMLFFIYFHIYFASNEQYSQTALGRQKYC